MEREETAASHGLGGTEPGWGRRRSAPKRAGEKEHVRSAWGGRLGRSLALHGRRRFMESVARQGFVEIQEQVGRERVGRASSVGATPDGAARRPPSPPPGRRPGRPNSGPGAGPGRPRGPRVPPAPGTARGRSDTRTRGGRRDWTRLRGACVRRGRGRLRSVGRRSSVGVPGGGVAAFASGEDCSRLGASKAAMNGGGAVRLKNVYRLRR